MNTRKLAGYGLLIFAVVAIFGPVLWLLKWVGLGIIVIALALAAIIAKGFELIG